MGELLTVGVRGQCGAQAWELDPRPGPEAKEDYCLWGHDQEERPSALSTSFILFHIIHTFSPDLYHVRFVPNGYAFPDAVMSKPHQGALNG